MKKNFLKNIFISVILVAILILPYFVFAGDDSVLGKLKLVGGAGGYEVSGDETQFSGILGTVVSAFLSLLGIIFVSQMIYAGYNWMVARGEEEKVEKAKDTIRRSIIGLVIIIGAYAIWMFIFYSKII